MNNKQLATFGGGCFWCVEAVMQRLKGVEKIVSGYAGGDTLNPDYPSICTGTTGHAEVIQVTFDADMISFEVLITIFIASHDPTTLNQQGADRGTQYRSIILYHNEEQKASSEQVIIRAKNVFPNPIVTEITALEKFYPAEENHQNYYNRNSSERYCSVVISPKIAKLREFYSDYLK